MGVVLFRDPDRKNERRRHPHSETHPGQFLKGPVGSRPTPGPRAVVREAAEGIIEYALIFRMSICCREDRSGNY